MAAGIITQNTAPRMLLPSAISTIYGTEYEIAAKKAIHTKLYEMKTSDRAYEEALQLVGIGPASLKDEGGTIEMDSYQQGYDRLSYHQVWAKKMRITEEAFEDNKHISQAQTMGKMLAQSSLLAKEINGHALFNNPTSTSAPFVGADGVAFLSTAHVLSKGGTLANKPSVDADLSEAAIEAACQGIWNWTDDANNRIFLKPKALFLHQNQVFDAHRILKSSLRVATADNDANALMDMGMIPEIIPSVYLTDTDAWFILVDGPGLVMYSRYATEQFSYNDDQTRDLVFGIKDRYVFDYYDPRAVFGSVGA